MNKANNNPINYTELTNIKHFPPAVREWNNSVYNFNKNNSSYSVVKYNQLDKLMNNYFNLSNNKNIARSKRMRYLRRKSGSRKFYLSKPEIKQSNDKISITVYTLDRDKQRLAKKLFFYNKPKLSQKILSLKKRTKIGKKYKTNLSKLYNIKFSGIKFIKELKTFRNKSLLKNKHLKESLYFQFFKYILSIFSIQVFIPLFIPITYKGNKNRKLYFYSKRRLKRENKRAILNIIESNPKILYWINHNTGVIDKIEQKDIKLDLLLKRLAEQRKTLNKKKLISNLQSQTANSFRLELNRKLWFILSKYIITNGITNNTLLKMFNRLSNHLSEISIHNLYEKRKKKVSKLINLFQYNLLKYKRLLPALKKLIDNLYNKKTELNLVNLRYFYLNSDIFTKVLISKIQKRISAMKAMRKSLKRAKPTIKLSSNRKVDMFNNLNFLSLNNSLSLNSLYNNTSRFVESSIEYTNKINKDVRNENILTTVFDKIYPYSHIYDKGYNVESDKANYKTKNVLSTIKYKSLLGVWIEAKGRLTRRNTAARSMIHRRYRGDLKDKDQYLYLNRENYVPTVILRNTMRSNTQYTSKGSFRRIGSFGIKTWISSK